MPLGKKFIQAVHELESSNVNPVATLPNTIPNTVFNKPPNMIHNTLNANTVAERN